MSTTKFAANIAIYFRDFLETNFHKRRAPKRSIKNRNEKNLLVGINLKTFGDLRSEIFKGVSDSLKQSIVIEKGKYTHGLSASTWQIITKYCDSLEEFRLVEVNSVLEGICKEITLKFSDDFDRCKDLIEERITESVAETFFKPLIQLISPTLKNSHLFDDEMLSSLNAELRDLLTQKAASLASDYSIANLVEKRATPLNAQHLITLGSLKDDIKTYFDNLKVEDLFFELSEIIANKEILDKQQAYLYLFEIKYLGASYPLFYIPFETKRTANSIALDFDSTAYINKKAIDYIVENINKTGDKRGKIKSIDERIIHLSEEDTSLFHIVETVANDLLSFCEIDGLFDLKSSRIQSLKSHQVTISNSCYFSLFDKSDEALVNDYEELISLVTSEGELGEKFCDLLESFLTKEPIRIDSNVSKEWDDTEVKEKLVNISPIPLNEEQNQVLSALKKENCKYVVVQGPPGTGKSHTITAMVFNAILDHQNVLVLSDKTEALDVVEDKITETLNNVRLSDDFQNPILRLGKAGNTYSKILSNESLENIKNHFKAVNKNQEALNTQIRKVSDGLKDKISKEIAEYEGVHIADIARLEHLEKWISLQPALPIVIEEFLNGNSDSIEDLESIHQIATDLSEMFEDTSPAITLFRKIWRTELSKDNLRLFQQCIEVASNLKSEEIDRLEFKRIRNLTLSNFDHLKSIVLRIEYLGQGFFGYLFKGRILKDLLLEFQNDFTSPEIVDLKKQLQVLKKTVWAYEILKKEIERQPLLSESKFDAESLVIQLLDSDISSIRQEIEALSSDLDEIEDFIEVYPKTASNFGLTSSASILYSSIPGINTTILEAVVESIRLRSKLEASFRNIPKYDYVQNKVAIERLYTIQMTHILDERVINFSEKHSARSKTLKKIISSKKRFPKEEFEYLKEAFPCIISGIRDYAEYIPLEAGLFDLVIIDEASQVSIAQALPAILRAKKIVVFGDKRQFSNIKSAQAKSEVNQQYVHGIRTSFAEARNPTASELERLSKFNIKTSVLDFFEYICNYTTMLRKHFRGYRELISYSSKYFYQDHLQAIKIRGKSIDETIQFVIIDHDKKRDQVENTNSLELNKILEIIDRLLLSKSNQSLGIITPHTNQQKMIFDRLMKHPYWDELQKKHKIKIMTFDTCQGEERDIVIYSMVASPADDKLSYIFIKNLKDIDFDEESKIKAQRLNVGFSRAKEKMIFVLSKPVAEFEGGIGEALRHYEKTLHHARSLPSGDDVDPSSPMEKKVLQWIQDTSFFKEHSASIELKAQFPIGEYLKQLDPRYRHPKYVCDFLLTYIDESTRSHKIILEYDGFKEHFTSLKDVSEFNYASYYKDEDVFRERVLEGYGYKFLRINRFNVGSNPIDVLDGRLRGLVRNNAVGTNPSFVKDIQSIVSSLEDGDLKECIKCGKLHPLSEFRDSSLISGEGRHCRSCKRTPVPRKRDRSTKAAIPKQKISTNASIPSCPRCSSPMRQRTGPRGEFWGCSRFPGCRGTRSRD